MSPDEVDARESPRSVSYPSQSEAPCIRYTLLVVFCLAQFLDSFNNSAFFAAIPPISVDLKIANGISVWLVSAYQLTFAALLLSSGRLSDLYNPKWLFVSGLLLMTFCALGAGFVRTQIPLFILRALMGVGAALNIPSAMSLIIRLFRKPAEQSKALAAFAGAAALGNVLGLVIGALLVSFASWPWVLYFCSMFSFVLALTTIIFLPSDRVREESITQSSRAIALKRLDLVGIFALTAALLLFILAVTSATINGWGTPIVIAPLVISVLLTSGFFVYESIIPEAYAAVPPSMWKYQNFPALIAVSLQPFMWWASVQFLFSWLYQEVYGWSTINTAVHLLPLGLVSIPVMGIASALQQRFSLKWVILSGQVLVLIGTSLLPFADSKQSYWRFAFSGMFIGTAGMTIVFATTNIALFAITPPEVAGVVGAIFACALQVGAAAGTAIVTSIQTSVQVRHGGPTNFSGRAASFWFLFAFNVMEMACVLVFMRNTIPPVKREEKKTSGEP